MLSLQPAALRRTASYSDIVNRISTAGDTALFNSLGVRLIGIAASHKALQIP